MAFHPRIAELFSSLHAGLAQEGALAVYSPVDGEKLASLGVDDSASLEKKIQKAKTAQSRFAKEPRAKREALLTVFSAGLKESCEILGELITRDGGKSIKEGAIEAEGAADVLLKTIHDASLPELNGMLRVKERPPVGVVGLITSFNFPLAVANWTIAPALLAGNAVLWKPSEKTPLVALAAKAIFDSVAAEYADLLQLIIGERDIGAAMVAHETVDMVSATGSVAMGEGIKKALMGKKNNAVKPILELGGNNGVIISNQSSPAHMEFAAASLMHSFLGTTGQRCTNTRRVIVQREIYPAFSELMENKIAVFLKTTRLGSPLTAPFNEYGYGPLIDEDVFARFENAKKQAAAEGGKIRFGARLLQKEFPHAYYIEPCLALMPKQTAIMHAETFAPLLFLAPYDDFAEALALVNAPENAGLVNGIYTQSKSEAAQFAAQNLAGHSIINSSKGTGTPAFGMGFSGNKASGEGEILNAADPLAAFTRTDRYSRIAINNAIALDRD